MRRRSVICTVLALAGGCVSDAAPDLSVVGLMTPASPLVTVRVMVESGSVDDPVGRNGLNALTALMIGRGGTASLSYE